MKLVAKFLALLNISDEGKIKNFLLRIQKKLKKDIVLLKHNISTKKLVFEGVLVDLQDKLADAKLRVEESLLSNVVLEDLKNNESMDSCIDKYLSGIKKTEDAVTSFEKQIEKLKEFHQTEIQEMEDQVAYIERKLEQICS